MNLVSGLLPLVVAVFCCGILLLSLSGTGEIWAMSQAAGWGENPAAPAIVEAALQMAAHLHRCGPEQLNQCYDAGFPRAAIAFWQQECPGCASWQNGNLQCVMLVTAAYALAGDPLPAVGNAEEFWRLYSRGSRVGWEEIPDGEGLPLPGDILVLSSLGGPGHVAVVVAVQWTQTSGPAQAQAQARTGRVTIAQANAPLAIESFDFVSGRLKLDWPGYQVLGYIRHVPARAGAGARAARTALAPAPTHEVTAAAQRLAQQLHVASSSLPYVQVAYQAALDVGLPPAFFVRQIDVESGFNPDAVSPAGAVGIAQLLPSTAAGLGVDPWDPVEALRGAARLMASYVSRYGGDYAQALAAYNAGPGQLQQALNACGAAWLSCLPAETQAYIHTILAGS
ncbi:transglycosylase SLT domain-containing protein [Thermogemmatispora sp.]|uniref:transglycosylase SLT domain-containing protein n=1 Tax=Thermogemmatispora sp. TaxID=1968838 RepID=UPI0035E434DB